MAIHMEDRFPIVDILAQTPPLPPELPVGALPAQPRRAHARDGDRRRARLHVSRLRRPGRHAHQPRHPPAARAAGGKRPPQDRAPRTGLLFSLPGTPVLYYGDEIGMGDNVYLGDRNGVRTPMQWSADRNAGFSRANPQQLILPVVIDPEYHYESINVENQQQQPHARSSGGPSGSSLCASASPPSGAEAIEFLAPSNSAHSGLRAAAGRRDGAGRGEPVAIHPVRRARLCRSTRACRRSSCSARRDSRPSAMRSTR